MSETLTGRRRHRVGGNDETSVLILQVEVTSREIRTTSHIYHGDYPNFDETTKWRDATIEDLTMHEVKPNARRQDVV